MAIQMIDKVRALTVKGKDTPYIAEKLGISETSVAAYKAHITRLKQHTRVEKEKYTPKDDRRVALTVQIDRSYLRTILGENKKDEHATTNRKEISLRDIVMNGLNDGRTAEDVRAQVDKSVTAYIAHYTRGSYKKN